jgi:hypothetical protein
MKIRNSLASKLNTVASLTEKLPRGARVDVSWDEAPDELIAELASLHGAELVCANTTSGVLVNEVRHYIRGVRIVAKAGSRRGTRSGLRLTST